MSKKHPMSVHLSPSTTDTIVLDPPFIPVTAFEQAVSDYMVEAWTNFIKGGTKTCQSHMCSSLLTSVIDPSLGPRISGWEKYDPNDGTTLAILGISESGAIPVNASVIDTSCDYWNTILPIYPQVSLS